jgi:hypothetical protein
MNFKKVLEYSSKELLELSKYDTPERYQRRLLLGPTRVVNAYIDYNSGNAVVSLTTHQHEQSLEVEDFVGLVADEILSKYKDGIPRNQLVRIVKVAMKLLLEEGDILVDCDCEDYKYRFNWLAKQYGFALTDRIIGYDYKPENSNPRLNGGICKHITKCLSRESQWADSASRKLINDLLKYDKFLNMIIMDEDDEDDEILFDDDYEKVAKDEPVQSYRDATRSAFTEDEPIDDEPVSDESIEDEDDYEFGESELVDNEEDDE